jgi:hypothetical protein
MSSERVQVSISDGGLNPATPLVGDVRSVFFALPGGGSLEVEAFVRHGETMIQIRTNHGVPVIVPRSGNVIAVGVQPW